MTDTPYIATKATPPCTFRFKSTRLRTRFKKVIERTGLSLHECINQAVEDFCQKHEHN